MRRVVVTGMGIVSCIGNNTQEVLSNLREGKSGISRSEEHVDWVSEVKYMGSLILILKSI